MQAWSQSRAGETADPGQREDSELLSSPKKRPRLDRHTYRNGHIHMQLNPHTSAEKRMQTSSFTHTGFAHILAHAYT